MASELDFNQENVSCSVASSIDFSESEKNPENVLHSYKAGNQPGLSAHL